LSGRGVVVKGEGRVVIEVSKLDDVEEVVLRVVLVLSELVLKYALEREKFG